MLRGILSYIQVDNVVLSGNKLFSRIHVPDGYEKYIKNRDFFAEYDTYVDVDRSILNIPAVAVAISLAWLTGSNLYVDSIDKAFKENMDKLQVLFKRMYPNLPGSTEIIADELVDNKIMVKDPDNRTSLFFSGGIDSTYSLLKNLEKNPYLVMIWGCDNFAYPERMTHWERAIDIYRDQAKRLGLEQFFVKTNVSQVLDDSRIAHDFYKILNYRSLRISISHSLVLLPLSAPLSINKFDHLLMAASGDASFDFDANPHACRPEADELIAWADLKVSQDGMVHRDVKMRETSRYLEDDRLTIRVCLRTSEEAARQGLLNDCSCEKCYRTIMNLIQEGIDPNTCGFRVDESMFKELQKYLQSDYVGSKNYYWGQIKSLIPEEIESDLCGSKGFMEFLRGYELPEPVDPGLSRRLYYTLPYDVARLVRLYLFNPLKIQI